MQIALFQKIYDNKFNKDQHIVSIQNLVLFTKFRSYFS